MSIEQVVAVQKKSYETPKLIRHGDVETITLGDDLGDDMDAAFTSSASALGKLKGKKNKDRFS